MRHGPRFDLDRPITVAIATTWNWLHGSLRHTIFKVIVCVALLLIFLIAAVVSLPSIVANNVFQADADFISARIKERIAPIPDFVLTPFVEDGKNLLALIVRSGRSTPYYYTADGIKQAYIRVGSESIPAPDHILNELILKGTNRTYDALATEFRKKDYSFTLLEATYLQRSHLHFSSSDYQSFGLVTKDDMLTRTGSLLTDQHIVYNSRVFCTRWKRFGRDFCFQQVLQQFVCVHVRTLLFLTVIG